MSICKDAIAYRKGDPIPFDIINIAIIFDIELAAIRYSIIKTLADEPLELLDQEGFEYLLNHTRNSLTKRQIKEAEKEIQAMLDEREESKHSNTDK